MREAGVRRLIDYGVEDAGNTSLGIACRAGGGAGAVRGYGWYRLSDTGKRWRYEGYEDKLKSYCAGVLPYEETVALTGLPSDPATRLPYDVGQGTPKQGYEFCWIKSLGIVVTAAGIPDGSVRRRTPQPRKKPMAPVPGFPGRVTRRSTRSRRPPADHLAPFAVCLLEDEDTDDSYRLEASFGLYALRERGNGLYSELTAKPTGGSVENEELFWASTDRPGDGPPPCFRSARRVQRPTIRPSRGPRGWCR
ncbi:hypothetical protein [Streptomyces sp. NPDC048436]|uniref:hypothetical protein n=1 Tax=Streptomyces sp. NPDC048436 TaxID=3365550 RepID=UPI003712E0EE